MAQITVNVNEKSYPLACAEGDEERLHKLASYVDVKARDLAGKLGHISESRILLMAAILIADELHESIDGQGGTGILGAISEGDLAKILNEVSSDIEGIAEKLTNA